MKARLPIEQINKLIPKGSKLTALYYLPETIFFGKTKRTAIVFSCSCGGKATLNPKKVTMGRQKSCGCLCFDGSKQRKYNSYHPRLRSIYYSMINRCNSPADTAYKYYGGRGVKVCSEWIENGQKFYDWAINNGWRQGLELDKDKKGNGLLYSPKTCCFLTRKENMNELRSNRRYKFRGKMLTVFQISEITNINAERIRARIETLKWAVEKAATQKVRKGNY